MSARLAQLSIVMAVAFSASAMAEPVCAVSSLGTQCVYYDMQSCWQAVGTSGACIAGGPRAGGVNIGASLAAGAEFARGLTAAERKARAYGALRKKYGDAVAGDPDAALKAQEFQLREQLNAITVQRAKANLAAQERRTAHIAEDLSGEPSQTVPCGKEDTEFAQWAKQNGYQHRTTCK